MRRSLKIITLVLLPIAFIACEPENELQTETVKDLPVTRSHFAKGADISWATEMESDNIKFYNMNNVEMECTALMKEIGMNAIRLRVWVDPIEGWCNMQDVLTKAKRAQELEMKLMIDFHYSDTWADPSNQKTPASWSGYDVTQMEKAVAEHTGTMLQMLKDNGIDIAWVQVGNEVNSGMLHPLGNINSSSGVSNFARFVNAGYKAVKTLYPESYVILHRSNGHETTGFDWFLSTAEANGIKYDMIGMSLYPTWWENGGFVDWTKNASLCIGNIRTFTEKYGKPVMICEVGMPVNEPEMSKEALQYILDETRKIEKCHGVFYWEPQVHSDWKPAYYEELGWNSYDKSAFMDGKPTAALDPFAN